MEIVLIELHGRGGINWVKLAIEIFRICGVFMEIMLYINT